MKIIIMLALVVLVAGCSLLTQPPNEETARWLEERRAEQGKELAINMRAKEYEKKGLNSRDAKVAAEVEYAKSGKR